MTKPLLLLLLTTLTACAGTVEEDAAPDPEHALVTFDGKMNTDQIGGFIGAASTWRLYTHGEVDLTFGLGPCEAKPCAQLGKGGLVDGVFNLPDSDDLTVRREAVQQIGEWLGRYADPAFFGPAPLSE